VSVRHKIFLERRDGALVDGELVEGIDEPYARKVDSSWLTHMAAIEAQAASRGETFARPEHWHWQWGNKVKELCHLISCPTFAIECEGKVQGMMTVVTDGYFCRLDEQRKAPLVYVWFVATAPWNLPAAGSGTYRGIGYTFLSTAIQMSFDLEFKGRIGLHSLPQAESYYDKIGMICLGSDTEKQGMKYYEMTPGQAQAFIS
jgi:hypothetical protein